MPMVSDAARLEQDTSVSMQWREGNKMYLGHKVYFVKREIAKLYFILPVNFNK